MRPIAAAVCLSVSLLAGVSAQAAFAGEPAAASQADPKRADTQFGEARPADTKPADPKPADPKPAEPKPAEPAELSAEECVVWARELSFARSIAEHDAKAFAAHLHPQAAFGAGRPQPSRGRDKIAAEWAGLIEGKQLRLRWYPVRVTIGGVGDVAWSTGPALYQRLDPGAQPRYLIGAYQSVWHRDADGIWRILFDDGLTPRPATEAEAMAFEHGRREACPRR
ncbi:YybH family protein [Lysobacter sp. TAB13]|uniref:YybH family protein n=1 Tax=Lysobacter sp. TAB13 TaxID=3233065 RepID=UPI003F952581